MPSGYTAAVADGTITDLKTFALLCARGMGACITMRDEPWDTPIPERFEPSNYHLKELDVIQAERQRLAGLSDEDAEREARADYEAAVQARNDYIAKNTAQAGVYRAMLDKVLAWDCKAEGIKDFMVSQLEESIRFDTGGSMDFYPEPARMTGAEWLMDRDAKLATRQAYHTDGHRKEVERTEARNAWLKALRDSLEGAG